MSNNFRIFAADFFVVIILVGYAHREVGVSFFLLKDLRISNNFRTFAVENG